MKKFLSLALLVVLVASMLAIATSATATSSYWAIDSGCLVKSKTLADGTVLTFKSAEGNYDGLLVGLPMNAKYGDAFFQAKDNYSIKCFDKNGKQITDSGTHIGTGEVIKVYDSNGAEVAQYGIVTYGDADGDGVFDVIDAYIAGLCLNGFIAPSEDPAVYEAVKPRVDADNGVVDILDYQQIVNDVISDNLTENKKGRKIPIDDTLNFDSIIYACDSEAKVASVTAADSRFKDIISIKYNGSATAPSSPGIYSVTAEIPDNTDYLVTPGTKELGFMVIAPKTGDGYTAIVDAANKKITIDITKPNAAGADLTGYINNWINSAYALSVSSKSVTNGTELATALNLSTYKHYTTDKNTLVVTIADKTITDTSKTSAPALGCYLPDDYTLWANNFVEKSIPVSVTNGAQSFGYTISFRQNAEAVKALDRETFMEKAVQGRGQRKVNPPDSTGAPGILIESWKEKEIFCSVKYRPNSSTGVYEKTIRSAIGLKGSESLLAVRLGGTGLKTLLLGPHDAICFVASSSKSALPAISASNQNILYDTANNNVRYQKYGSSDLEDSNLKKRFMNLVDGVLGGFDNLTVSETSTTRNLRGKSGWCRYGCADTETGLRYTSDYFLEFLDVNTTEDTHRLLTVVPVQGCTITTNPAQGTACGKMNQYETFTVTAKLAEGYKPSVKDANGNDVPYDAVNGWYIMPASDVIVTAVPQ